MKKKKVLSMLLAATMIASLLAGCGSSNGDSNNNSGSKNNAAEGTESGSTGDGYSKEIDMDEDPYTVAIQLVVLPGVDYSSFETDMENAINEITEPAINCDVDIQFETIDKVTSDTSLAVANDEKVDLLHVATVTPLSSMVGSDILLDMNEGSLLQTRGADLVSLFGSDLLAAGNVDGQQLAVPAKIYNSSAKGIYYNKTLADSLGITVPDTMTMDEFGDILKEVSEKDADIMPFYVGNGANNLLYWIDSYSGFGTNCSYGAILDEQSDTTIENIYETELFKNMCETFYQWRQDGLIQKDSTDQTSAQDYYNAQQLFASLADITPQLEANYKANSEANGFETGFSQMVDPSITNASVTEYMWGIAANSERPDKAMDFLNFIYTNADVANILMYGLEGTNYTYKEGSDTVIETNGSYISSFVNCGDTSKMLIQSPNDDTYIEQWENQMKEAAVSPLLGYMFSDADYQTESAAIGTVIAQYLPMLQNGTFDSEDEMLSYLDEFNSALKDAGIDDVIAANQEQLNEWLASK